MKRSTCLKIVQNRESTSSVHGNSDCLKKMIIEMNTIISDKTLGCIMNKNKAIDEKVGSRLCTTIRWCISVDVLRQTISEDNYIVVPTRRRLADGTPEIHTNDLKYCKRTERDLR